MPSLKERASAAVDRVRERFPLLDHVVRMVQHYTSVNGNAQAGAVTFFGFLSFFPILALGFFLVGLIAQVYPDLRADLRVEIENLLPGVVGGGQGEIPLRTFESYAGTVGVVGLVGVLYSGLGWLSGMRSALEVMFVLPAREQPNFVMGKLRDLGTLVLIGLTLLLSVLLSGLIAGFSERILGWVGLDPASPLPFMLLWLLGHGLAVAASTVLLLAMFRLLAQPHLPRHALVTGALLGAVGFELLKSLASFLIAQTKGQPAFQAFGVALILVVWINYFSRLVMFAAAWAYTSPVAVELRTRESTRAPAAALSGTGSGEPDSGAGAASDPPPAGSPAASNGDRTGGARVAGVVVAGALLGGALVAARRKGRPVM